MYDSFELGVQAWDKLDEFMSIVIGTGNICIEGCLDVGNAEEKDFNGGCIFILLSAHTREGSGSNDAIHCVLIALHFTKVFFHAMVFSSVFNDIVVGLVQNFITFGHGYGQGCVSSFIGVSALVEVL